MSDTYRSIHGEEPLRDRQADHDGLQALVTWMKESTGGECDPSRVSEETSASLESAFRMSPSPFDAARYLIAQFPEPLTERQYVWISYGGQVYHRYSDCSGLGEGRAKAGRDGKCRAVPYLRRGGSNATRLWSGHAASMQGLYALTRRWNLSGPRRSMGA